LDSVVRFSRYRPSFDEFGTTEYQAGGFGGAELAL
jgi:hypothetical protein